MPNDLFYYLKQVQRRAGLPVSSSFPSSATDEEQYVLDCINEQLRYLNSKHYLTFRQTEYTLTTTAGSNTYNLENSPYSQSYWRVHRIARNGVRRAADDFPLTFLDYSELDYLHPSTASNGDCRFYSAIGEALILHPPPDGDQYKIRYYSVAIGTDTTGATPKTTLSVTSDLPMLDDIWEDCLTVGATMKVRSRDKVDEKYAEYKRMWEDWESILIDMGNQPGEEAGPQLVMTPYLYDDLGFKGKFYPFFTNVPGA